jgi:hypothetical protein
LLSEAAPQSTFAIPLGPLSGSSRLTKGPANRHVASHSGAPPWEGGARQSGSQDEAVRTA